MEEEDQLYLGKMIKVFNRVSIQMIKNSQYTKGHTLLTRLMKFLEPLEDVSELISLTLNNLSCILKEQGRLQSA